MNSQSIGKTKTMKSGYTSSLGRRFHLVPFLLALVAVLGFSSPGHAQTARIKHVITSSHNHAPVMGRELFFALPQNYLDQSGKYFFLYVTSPAQTTVHVETSMGTQVQTVSPYKVAAFNLPLGWEIKSQNVVEDKGIRVWSSDADITAYLMSHNPYTSDGMYIMPTIGWGTDYVVGAFASLDAFGGAGDGDEPSEFVVVANKDNTQVDIVPSCDLRDNGYGTKLYSKGQHISVRLNRGQCIQYKATGGGDPESQDVTGSVVHSNYPVGVIGASQCPDVPLGYPYCDHILDMMPSVRTWAVTYYTAPSYQRLKGDTFLIINTVQGQVIRRQGAQSGDRQEAVMGAPYSTYWTNDVAEGSKWYSDQPFLLVQYLNSSTWDCQTCGFGDPAEVVVNPVEQFSNTVVFQTPTSQGSQSPYTNYVNLIVNTNAAKNTTFDGQNITKFTKITVDGKYDIFRAMNIKPGTHIVKSDSGVGVYVYGYGSYESYAWTGSFGTGTYNSPDTIAPLAVTNGSCFDAHVGLTDTTAKATKLGEIRVDTTYNMAFFLDPSWIEGTGIPESYYDMFVVDSTKEAYLAVSAFDLAGNQTTITSTYQPQVAIGQPLVLNFGQGVVNVGPAVERYLTITNTGKVKFDLQKLYLALKTKGFTLDSAVTSPIDVGEIRKIKIGFIPKNGSAVTDTVIYGDDCIQQMAILTGTGGSPDFTVTDDHFGNVLQNTASKNYQVLVTNTGSSPITLDSIWTDSPMFTYDSTLNVVIPGGVTQPLPFSFHAPNNIGFYTAPHGHFRSIEAGTKTDSLDGSVIAPAYAVFQDTTITLDCAQPGDSVNLQFYVEATGSASSIVSNWTHSAATDPAFRNFQATRQNLQPVNPGSQVVLNPHDRLLINEDFIVPASGTGTYLDKITAFDQNGDTIKTVTATIHTTYRSQAEPDQLVDYGIEPYKLGTPNVQTSRIINDAKDDLTIYNVGLVPGGQFNNAYTVIGADIHSVGGTVTPVTTYPVTLKPNDTLIARVQFDPTVNAIQYQNAILGVSTNACNQAQQITLNSTLSVSGSHGQTYNAPEISACATSTNAITVTNDKLAPNAVDTITAITIDGADASNYSFDNSVIGKTMTGVGGTMSVPVTFTASAARAFNARMIVELHNTWGNVEYDTIPLTNTAGTGAATVSSTFATQDQSQTVGATVTLPINFSFNKNGVQAPLTDMKIQAIRLTYLFNTDLLSIDGATPSSAAKTQQAIVNAVRNLPNGWSVDAANSSLTNGKLVLVLTNPNFLDETVNSLGSITFKVTLPKDDTTQTITLQSVELLTASNGTYTALSPQCAAGTAQGGNFSLIYACGDKTLQQVMAGNTTLAVVEPATPNPVQRGNVTLRYATRVSAPVTLTISDMLGNEVARVVDNVPHQPGVYEVHYNTTSLPSGTYTYTLRVNGVVSSKQFVVTH